MILCVCQGVSERAVCETIVEGAESIDAVTRRCGAGGDCGSCHDEIREMIHAAARPALHVAA